MNRKTCSGVAAMTVAASTRTLHLPLATIMALSAMWHQVPSSGYCVRVRGLRETKKASTSQAIVDAAIDLLRGRHFSDVSVDEIATAAGIGRRTFFRYFPSKEDVFLDRRRLEAYLRDLEKR